LLNWTYTDPTIDPASGLPRLTVTTRWSRYYVSRPLKAGVVDTSKPGLLYREYCADTGGAAVVSTIALARQIQGTTDPTVSWTCPASAPGCALIGSGLVSPAPASVALNVELQDRSTVLAFGVSGVRRSSS